MKTRHTPLRQAFRRPWPGTRRGLVLWELSIVIMIIGGANYIGTTLPPATREGLSLVLALAPATTWGWCFVVVGVVSAWSSYCHFDRDQWGYNLAALATGMWACAYIAGFVFHTHNVRTLGSATIWFAFCAVLLTCAGFPKTPLDFGRRS